MNKTTITTNNIKTLTNKTTIRKRCKTYTLTISHLLITNEKLILQLMQ